ncbi:MAG: glycoside hydrolase family 2 protein [Ignavibacteria bacterium]|nr:glycoside hydrolase family 2 protein [Ignavibacteria bacterium]
MKNTPFFSIIFLLLFSIFCFLYSQHPVNADTLRKSDYSTSEYQQKRIYLNEGWKFRRVGDTAWYPATVPGTVHTDLLANGLIPDPFLGDNEKQIQWIEKEAWEYKTDLNITEEQLKESVQIIFEGLDTYAEAFINGNQVLSSENMFRSWAVTCDGMMKKGINILTVVFYPPVQRENNLSVFHNNLTGIKSVPGGNRLFTRKAAYHYGWDWGPKFVTCGIWKPAYLEYGSENQIHEIETEQVIGDNKAGINFNVNCGKPPGNLELILEDARSNVILSTTKVDNELTTLQAEIRNPRLWWCNGMGEQYLYKFRIILKREGQILDEKYVTAGLRTIEFIREPDTSGQSFYYKLNGVPVFIKGANYIPRESFLPRTTEEKYSNLLKTTAQSNINMLRVWGGGAYEDDRFYDLCDSLGILVWQDFMFACSMVPVDTMFANNVRQEAAYTIKRLRNHPCIALWCGNNEIDEGWKNWGWQNDYTGPEKEKLWNGYKNIFHKLLPKTVLQYNKNTAYITTSPTHGWGRKESLTEGDSHYWGVWWGMEPFETYEKKVPRFMSEYGFQSFPDLKSIKRFLKEEDMYLYSDALKVHQKHPTGFETIQKYMEREYRQPKDFESYVYVSQLLQAYGIKRAIEAQRRAKPYCMGTLYWQLNDCWPVVSWSGIDYYGSVKPMQHFVRDAYRDMLVSFEKKDDNINVYVVNDGIYGAEGALQLKLVDFNGNVLWQNSKVIKINENSSEKFFEFKADTLTGKHNPNEILLTAKLNIINGKAEYTNEYFFADPNDLNLKDPGFDYDLQEQGESAVLKLWCTNFAKDVKIDYGTDRTYLDMKNYFNMIPGVPVYIVLGKNAIKNNALNLKITSLYDTYNK